MSVVHEKTFQRTKHPVESDRLLHPLSPYPTRKGGDTTDTINSITACEIAPGTTQRYRLKGFWLCCPAAQKLMVNMGFWERTEGAVPVIPRLA